MLTRKQFRFWPPGCLRQSHTKGHVFPSQGAEVKGRRQRVLGASELPKSSSPTRLAPDRHPTVHSISANVGEENNETLKMQQEHSHKMAHASMPSAKTKWKMFLENEKTEQKRKKEKEKRKKPRKKQNSVSNK